MFIYLIASELGGKKSGIRGAGGVQKRKKKLPANLAAARERIKSVFRPAAISKNDKKLSNNDKKKERYFSISLPFQRLSPYSGIYSMKVFFFEFFFL